MKTHHVAMGRLVGSGAELNFVAPPHTQLLARAKSLHEGLLTLVSSGPETRTAAVFLASWALELALKAHLVQRGKTKRELRPIQHDLTALWQLAFAEGLPLASSPPHWCSLLSQTHDAPYHQRYGSNTPISVWPAIQAVVVGLTELLLVIEKQQSTPHG